MQRSAAAARAAYQPLLTAPLPARLTALFDKTPAANPALVGPLASWGWIGAGLLFVGLSQIFLMAAAGHLSIDRSVSELLAPRGLATGAAGACCPRRAPSAPA